jgi:hypothetical protein
VRIVVPNRLTSSRLPHALIAWCIARGLRRIYANRTAEPLIIERSESEDLEQISLGSNREGSQYLIKERGCRH